MKYKSGANLLPVCLATSDTGQAPASGWVYFIKYLKQNEAIACMNWVLDCYNPDGWCVVFVLLWFVVVMH